jgi:hypothetical protein
MEDMNDILPHFFFYYRPLIEDLNETLKKRREENKNGLSNIKEFEKSKTKAPPCQ